jgi:hypothetical protein
MESKTPTKDRLKKKVNKKNGVEKSEDNIFDMLTKVSEVLKNDPVIVQKVNKCVAQLIDNKELMASLTKEIQSNINITNLPEDFPLADQILASSSVGDEPEAKSKNSKQ